MSRDTLACLPHLVRSSVSYTFHDCTYLLSEAWNLHVSLLPNASSNSSAKCEGRKPAHWKDAKGTAFQNPWPSYVDKSFWDVVTFLMRQTTEAAPIPHDVQIQIPSIRPTWGIATSSNGPDNAERIKATWLGHACFLVELPIRHSSSSHPLRGPRILFDPVFSDRCSPGQWFGPSRFTKLPCQIADVPEVDAIVISHNHYDHLDTDTIKAFTKRPHSPHLFVPLGNAELLRSIGIAKDKIHSLDWWESRRVQVEVANSAKDGPTSEPTKVAFDVTCTPCQHQSNRSLFDRFKALWGSWVVQEVIPPESSGTEQREGAKVYFAGDTGYRTVPEGADEGQVPVCPAFREIGERFGGFDFAMIPIGAYQPRDFMSALHCAPQDSVRIFKDVRAKKALGMHWGTWRLTTELVTEPPKKLAEECKKAGISREDFNVCQLGETSFF